MTINGNKRQVLRWEVPVDDDWHAIGSGEVVHVAVREESLNRTAINRIEVWTLEPDPQYRSTRAVRAYGTGQPIADADTYHLGTAIVPGVRLVWHLFGAAP